MEFSKELIAKAKACKSEAELKALAAENSIEITDDELKLFLADNAEGELSDDELEAVSGGKKGCKRNAHGTVFFNSEEEVEYIFDVGDVLQAFIGAVVGNETATVQITERGAVTSLENNYWRDMYKYKRLDGSPTHWGIGWQPRSRFEK